MLDLVGLGKALGLLLLGVRDDDFARAGNVGESEDLDRLGRSRFLDAPALIVDHRADAAVACACGDRVSDVERALLDQHVGDRASALIKLCFNDSAGS